MSQEADVLIRLEQEIHSKAEAIVRKAQKEADQIKAEAIKEKEAILAAAQNRATQEIKQLRARSLAQAELETRQQQVRVKAEAVRDAIRSAGEKLAGETRGEKYQKALRKFLEEALEALKPSKGPFLIRTRKEDESAVKQFAKEIGSSATVETSAHLQGGLEVIDEKAHTRIVNTFESRLRRGYDQVSEEVRKVLRV